MGGLDFNLPLSQILQDLFQGRPNFFGQKNIHILRDTIVVRYFKHETTKHSRNVPSRSLPDVEKDRIGLSSSNKEMAGGLPGRSRTGGLLGPRPWLIPVSVSNIEVGIIPNFEDTLTNATNFPITMGMF